MPSPYHKVSDMVASKTSSTNENTKGRNYITQFLPFVNILQMGKSVCRNNRDDVPLPVEFHFVYAHLPMCTRNATTAIYEIRVDAMIYNAPVVTIGNLTDAVLPLLYF